MSFFIKLGIGLGLVSRPVRGKSGARAYVIGDVHGCVAPLEALLDAIAVDLAERPSQETFVIFLGDLIDRGPDSAGVIERLLNYAPAEVCPVFIMGNHEEFLVRTLSSEAGILQQWLEYGGRECAASYGLSPGRLTALNEATAAALLADFIPPSHRRFIDGFVDTFRFGDYLLVHAGIRPGVPLAEQRSSDLRWIREQFLDDRGDLGFTVVHGHTIVPEVEVRRNRIGIDTGAYQGGPLTALVLEGQDRRLLQARGSSVTASAL